LGNTLQDKTVVVVGRGSGIARAVTLLARAEGARVVVAGRDKDKLAGAYDDPGITAEVVDVTDDESIGALAERVGPVDHLVSTASARARGKLAELERRNLQLSFDTKVIGPTMLAKHFASQLQPGGSLVLFSGVHAFKVKVGYLGVAITNGAVDFLTRSLAVELAPIGSTPSLQESSTPARGTPWARRESMPTSRTSGVVTPRAASGPPRTSPMPFSSR
jgi:NAD(P)-dependent dehydrogenase (short-subunit alcohol dehydrogenase family)